MNFANLVNFFKVYIYMCKYFIYIYAAFLFSPLLTYFLSYQIPLSSIPAFLCPHLFLRVLVGTQKDPLT